MYTESKTLWLATIYGDQTLTHLPLAMDLLNKSHIFQNWDGMPGPK